MKKERIVLDEALNIQGEILRKKREGLGYSIEHVASRSGVDAKVIAGFEEGKYEKKIDDHEKVLDALGIPSYKLIEVMETVWQSRYNNVPLLSEALRMEAEEDSFVKDRFGFQRKRQ